MSFPVATISNGPMAAVVCLPDAERGAYRSTRFDWSGIMSSLTYRGHEFCPRWFTRRESGVRDFVYRGDEIVVGDESAATGPVEEFPTPQGYLTAAPGGRFVKVGVGVLRKARDAAYSPFDAYEVVDSGHWTTHTRANATAFEQRLDDGGTGHAYVYRKVLSLDRDRPVLTIEHRLQNTGRLPIETSQYNHNFLSIDGAATGPGLSIALPFPIRTTEPPDPALATMAGGTVDYRRALTGAERVACRIDGFGADVVDHDIRLVNRRLGVGVRITADRPLVGMYLWSIRSVVSVEPFVDVTTAPAAETTWTRRYEFFDP